MIKQASIQQDSSPHVVEKEGLHILSNFTSDQASLLITCLSFQKFINEQINRLSLSKVGEAYHDFHGGGFTGVICLAESHLSIHTWPDRQYVTFDIYLSNFSQDNSPKAEALYKSVVKFFDATVIFENSIRR